MLVPLAAPHGVRPFLVRRAVVTGLLVLSSFSVLATEPPLGLSQAQQLAVARSRQIVAQNQAIIASREMAVAAGQLADPVLKVGIDNLPVNGPDRGSLTSDFMTMRRVGVMQELTGSDKRQLRAARFERAADKSIAEKNTLIAAIQRDTAIAWLDRYYTERIMDLVAEQGVQARIEVEAAEGSYRAGHGSQADIFVARSTLSLLDDRASEIQRKLRNAKTMLSRWVGLPSDVVLDGIPAIDTIRLDLASLETTLAHHPQIAMLSKQIDIADAEVKLAEANKKSDWSVEVAFQQRGSAYSNMISIGLSLPFQWDQKNRQDRELSAKLAMAEQTKAEHDEQLRAHVAETRAMLDEWETNRERAIRYEKELIPLAQERTQALVAAYRGGKSSLTELLAARRAEVDIRLQLLQLQADTARLWAQLNFLFPVGVQTNDIPSSVNKEQP
ncbi:TolC family protein [Undibacterium sp. Rencai35W]|uniref:TolC family protein n=1 Tax=Undibacterium sp. Rencai35W TaxID=3413046 RepID=UPI003BF20FFC